MQATKDFSLVLHNGKVVFIGSRKDATKKLLENRDATDVMHTYLEGAEFDFGMYGKETESKLIEQGYIKEQR